jgi:cytochrome c peroxidase
MNDRGIIAFALAFGALLSGCGDQSPRVVGLADDPGDERLDERLQAELASRGFTGRIESQLQAHLGRAIDPDRAELGRLLFFDPILSLTQDNSCAGCHGPNVSFNDSRSISIGIANNGIVGPDRRGPHNKRRAPTVVNAAFYQALMWDSRFRSLSFDPFDNSLGFRLPAPEGMSLSSLNHLLAAQAFTPVVARQEMTGYEFQGDHDAIRREIARRVWDFNEYRNRFRESFTDIADGAPLTYAHIAYALAEFEFTLVYADAPIDRYARGDRNAMSDDEKRGAIVFFDKAQCAECHLVRGFGAEMFSDFDMRALAVPQLVPVDGNMRLDGPGANEDYGLEEITGDPEDRYKFRTTPLRNVAFQPTFMHDGAYRCLDQAIRHHTSLYKTLRSFTTESLEEGLQGPIGPIEPMIERVHRLIGDPPELSEAQIQSIILFVGESLTDPDAAPALQMRFIPDAVPSGLPVAKFQLDQAKPECGN